MKIKNKKGIMLNQAAGAVLALVLIAVLVIVSLYMFSSIGTSVPSVPQTVVNESATLSAAGDALNNNTDCAFTSPSIISVVNTSTGVTIPAANYTLSSTGILRNATAITNVMAGANKVTYSYSYGGPACVASDGIITQFATYPALIGLVGTIIFLGIIIGVLAASFMFGRKNQA